MTSQVPRVVWLTVRIISTRWRREADMPCGRVLLAVVVLYEFPEPFVFVDQLPVRISDEFGLPGG